jgi:hypothetical protein
MWMPSIMHTCKASNILADKATTKYHHHTVVLDCSRDSLPFLPPPAPPPSPVFFFHPRTEQREMATEGERWVGLAVDFSEGSRAALKWAADNLLRTGDSLLLLHVVKDPDYEQRETILWEATGSRTCSANSTHPPPDLHLNCSLRPENTSIRARFGSASAQG